MNIFIRILLFASENVRNDVIAIYRPPSVRQPSGHYFFKIFWNSLSNSFTNYKLYESIFHIYTYAWYNININFNVSYSYCKSDVLINLFVYICIHNVYHIYIYYLFNVIESYHYLLIFIMSVCNQSLLPPSYIRISST